MGISRQQLQIDGFSKCRSKSFTNSGTSSQQPHPDPRRFSYASEDSVLSSSSSLSDIWSSEPMTSTRLSWGETLSGHWVEESTAHSKAWGSNDIERSVAGQAWHQGDLCTKGWRGIGEEREGRRNDEVDRNEVGTRRNERDI